MGPDFGRGREIKMDQYTGILFYFVLVAGFTVFALFLSYIFGPRSTSPDKFMPYECGVNPLGSARIRFSIKFYLVAMLFIIFDIEAVFLYPFAMIFRELKWLGLIEIAVFIVILMTGFVYVWGKGALEWE